MWKTFKFFDKELLKDPQTNKPYDDLESFRVTCTTGGSGQIILGESNGKMHFLSLVDGGNIRLQTVPAYHSKITNIHQLKQNSLVVTVGYDEPDQSLIKVWDCSKLDRLGVANQLRTIKPQLPQKKFDITCIAVDEHQSFLVAGFLTGEILLIKGNLSRFWSSKQQIIPVGIKEAITGLAFTNWNSDTYLFITTEKGVYSHKMTGVQMTTTLGHEGCKLGCCVMSDSSQNHKFVVVSEYTSFYFPTERAQSFVFEGQKMMVNWSKGHLIIVKKGSDKPSANLAGITPSVEQYTVVLCDIQHNFIASTIPFTSRVLGVVPEWGVINILTADGKITQLREHDTQSKLETLFKRNLFDYAVNLARSQSYDDGLAEIRRRYGDHLYSKGDYGSAIEQYKNAIKHLEPSYVIRKYLDAQQIENLTSYLKALHDEGLAKSDHTTLLLNCYTKLDREEGDKVKEFIESCKPGNFDIEAAIRVCRQSDFHEYAMELARRHGQHDWYMIIQIEDRKKYKEALDYIQRLSFRDATTYTKKYGKTLMAAEPDLTTRVITSLCLGQWRTTEAIDRSAELQAHPDKFIHIFVDHSERLMHFLESSVKHVKCSKAVYNTLLELYMSQKIKMSDEEREAKVMSLLSNTEASYDDHHALILAEMHHIQAAVLYLYEHKLEMYQPILQFHMEHSQHEEVFKTCENHGKQDKNLWVLALQYFARVETDKRSDYIKQTLKHIDQYKLLPPLMIVEILAKSKLTQLGDVKEYIADKLHQENSAIAADEALIRKYQEDTARTKEQLEELRTKARVFQVMKCSTCNSGLYLPAIHFLCKHSYHYSCLEEGEDGKFHCPICYKEDETVIATLQELDAVTNVNEDFHRLLDRRVGDGFTVVAEYFGRGVMNKTSAGQKSGTSAM